MSSSTLTQPHIWYSHGLLYRERFAVTVPVPASVLALMFRIPATLQPREPQDRIETSSNQARRRVAYPLGCSGRNCCAVISRTSHRRTNLHAHRHTPGIICTSAGYRRRCFRGSLQVMHLGLCKLACERLAGEIPTSTIPVNRLHARSYACCPPPGHEATLSSLDVHIAEWPTPPGKTHFVCT